MRTRIQSTKEVKPFNSSPISFIADHIRIPGDSREVLEQYYELRIQEFQSQLKSLNIFDHPREITRICMRILAVQKELKRGRKKDH